MSPEIRIDPLTGQKTIVAGDRASRPGGGLSAAPPDPIDPEKDPFAEGHEDRTPPELYAVRPGGSAADTPGWTVRVVPNLYPALDPASEAPAAFAAPELFSAAAATGGHEVIVNGPQSVLCLADLPQEQVAAAVEVWRERMRHHFAGGAAYVHLITNERREAGASLAHTHSQLYALPFVPSAIARERERFGAYAARNMGSNLLGDLVAQEVKLRERVVAIDDETVLMAPYGARLPFQLMIAPRAPRARFEDEGPSGAAMLHRALRLLAARLGASPPLNLWVRTAPHGAESFCWRIDIVPRLVHLAGLELGAGVHLNIVSPETVAAELRELVT
jgi:UDPglucose--hexose-1-phosphate uridylyltransferase